MGTIAGSVRDGSSNPVANAQVLVTGGSFSAAATTDVNGNYSLIGVPAGTSYSATASAAGFLNSTQNGITVSADVTTNVNFTMASAAAATPTFTPPAGNYSSTQSVTISTTTPGASIRYTTDGSTPSSTTGTVYSGASFREQQPDPQSHRIRNRADRQRGGFRSLHNHYPSGDADFQPARGKLQLNADR